MQHPHVKGQMHPGPRKYVVIGVLLTLITMLEVGVFYLSFTGAVMTGLLLFLSFTKFSLVVGYFMHLRFDDRRFLGVFAFPLVVMISLVVVLLAVFQNLTR